MRLFYQYSKSSILQAEYIQALIVTPTRELALQITDEIEKMIINMDAIHVLAVYGGQDVDKQLKKLKKNIQIVVGTPRSITRSH